MEHATVLGADNGIGKAVVDELLKTNITTKVLVNSLENFKLLYPHEIEGKVEVIEGDLDNNQAVAVSCEYADTIFPCFNTGTISQNPNWATAIVNWIEKISNIAVAMQSRIIYPGNVTNYGLVETDANPVTEEHPKQPQTQRGQLQVAIEYRLIRAANEGASLTVLRFPELYGPAILNNITTPVFRSALRNETSRWFGDPYKKFDLLYVKDAAKAMVQVALSAKAADTELNVPGPKQLEPDNWLKQIYEEAGATVRQQYSIKSKWQLYLASILNKEIRHITDNYYLFEDPIIMEGTKFEQIIGKLQYTEHKIAIRETLDWYSYWFDLTG